ncbi:MAG: SURF1 family protein [Kiloniellales bacterium]|nr:SURF1 family protein [Kiloniellales bacterium]
MALGSWQVLRLQEKEALITDLTARFEADARPIPENLSDIENLRFVKVRAEGRYLHSREVHLTNRILDKKVGSHLVTPFQLNDGRTLLVDRGWVALRQNARGPVNRPEGSLMIEGILREGGFSGPRFLRPENDRTAGEYHWPDLQTMAEGTAAPIVSLYLVLTRADHPGPSPKPNPPSVDIPNNHLEYAITWYALAFILLVIYIIFHRRGPKSQSRDPDRIDP